MTGSLLIASLAALFVWWTGRAALPVAAPFILAWLVAPAIARWVSVAPIDAGRLAISEADARSLRLIARRTWRFFETFVTAEDNMLPPDNFQEDPSPIVAHRTSPTNMGLLLLSTAAARDFGWIGTLEAVERLEATLATMERLKRFRGHFFNWYDTSDLRPLDPPYISSVDSGNLAGHLIALANACAAWRGNPVDATGSIAGAADSLALAREALEALPDDRRTHLVTSRELSGALDDLAAASLQLPDRLDDLALHAGKAADLARALASERADAASADMLFWVEAAQRSIESHRRDVVARHRAGGSAGAPAADHRGHVPGHGERHGIRFPPQPGPPPAFDRLHRRRGCTRSQLLRPARLGSPSRQLRGDRHGRRAGPPLVPARP